jgi:hypothetical protein
MIVICLFQLTPKLSVDYHRFVFLQIYAFSLISHISFGLIESVQPNLFVSLIAANGSFLKKWGGLLN